jgi:hypothetical protein
LLLSGICLFCLRIEIFAAQQPVKARQHHREVPQETFSVGRWFIAGWAADQQIKNQPLRACRHACRQGPCSEYEAGPYKGYGKKIQEAFAAIVPDDADVGAVAEAIMKVVDAPLGRRRFRVRIDPPGRSRGSVWSDRSCSNGDAQSRPPG